MLLNQLPAPASFADFSLQYPLLVDKLVRWSGFRGHVHELGAAAYVEDYVNDLIVVPPSTRGLQRWDQLHQREKEVVARFFHVDDTILKEKENSDWYRAMVGADYTANVEPVVEVFTTSGKMDGAVTINSYGCHVLNCLNMMIVDVDLNSNSDKAMVVRSEEMALHALLYTIAQTTNTGWRVYRTAAGLRYIETTRAWDPTSRDTKFLMQGLYADPLFVTLCGKQETFRARLTPKHWRSSLLCREDSDLSAYFAESFSPTHEGEAVCSLVMSLGQDKIAPEFKELVAFHDEQTKSITRYRRRNITYVLT